MNFLETAETLKDLFIADPQAVEQPLLMQAKALIGYFEDKQIKISRPGYFPAIEEAIKDAILDISSGGDLLKACQIGVSYHENKFEKFYALHGEHPEGQVAFAIYLKKFKAFHQSKQKSDGDEISQEVLNLITYGLIYQWAQLTKKLAKASSTPLKSA